MVGKVVIYSEWDPDDVQVHFWVGGFTMKASWEAANQIEKMLEEKVKWEFDNKKLILHTNLAKLEYPANKSIPMGDWMIVPVGTLTGVWHKCLTKEGEKDWVFVGTNGITNCPRCDIEVPKLVKFAWKLQK
jgi:hypothetical protein